MELDSGRDAGASTFSHRLQGGDNGSDVRLHVLEAVNTKEIHMAFSEFELKKYEKAVKEFIEKNRPPIHIRKELDLGYKIEGQSVELFEVRPRWDNRNKTVHISVAKATYVQARNIWKIYWKRSDLKWHEYGPYPEAKGIEEFLEVVKSDAFGCFFG